jgi:hypothetical protein
VLAENSFLGRILEPRSGENCRIDRQKATKKTVMSISNAENQIRIARQQMSQRDINESLLKIASELLAECKRLEDEVRRVRRDVQVGRRFG